MTIETIKARLFQIARHVLEKDEVTEDTDVTHWAHMTILNDEACMFFNINIPHADTSKCRTVGEFLTLVQKKLQ